MWLLMVCVPAEGSGGRWRLTCTLGLAVPRTADVHAGLGGAAPRADVHARRCRAAADEHAERCRARCRPRWGKNGLSPVHKQYAFRTNVEHMVELLIDNAANLHPTVKLI